MDNAAPALLNISLVAYVIGAAAGLLFIRSERLANLFGFGSGAIAGLCGVIASVLSLLTGAPGRNESLQVLPALIPYVEFTIRPGALGLFFVLMVSLLALALSIYSLGYARGFYGRKNVGVLG